MEKEPPRPVFVAIFLALWTASVFAGDASNEPNQVRDFSEEIEYIESLRGLEFPDRIEHRVIRRDELETFLRDTVERDLPIPSSDYFQVLSALYLIDPEADTPFETLLDLYVSQVMAFYDPVEDVFYSIEDDPESPLGEITATFEQAVTIHELVHVLQDQRFGAGKKLESFIDDWDRSLAYRALIEGEATLVMLAAMVENLGGSVEEALADDQIALALSEAASGLQIGAEAPAYFVESLKFPYVDGLSYVLDLYREGGWGAIEAAHQEPPRSTEMIYEGEPPGSVEPLMIEGTLLETTLGEFHWRFLLGEEVADGWEADRVAVSRHELGLSVVAVTEWDSTDAAGHFAEHYVSFLREKGVEPVVKRKGARVLVAYGPGETGEELMRRLLPRDEEQEMERSPSR